MTSELLSDAEICEKLRGGAAMWPVPQLAAARIEALTAERDFFAESAKNAGQEGERRATAAIVADLSDVCGAWPRGTSHASILAGRYKRGDHLKPLDT